jgi:hypothetical protein
MAVTDEVEKIQARIVRNVSQAGNGITDAT